MTTGLGCAGSGVQLISTCFPKTIEVISYEEFQELRGNSEQIVKPRLKVDFEEEKIFLELQKGGYRPKPGRTRNPRLPSIVADSENEEFFMSQDAWKSLDITSRLNEIGVNMGETMEDNRIYSRIQRTN